MYQASNNFCTLSTTSSVDSDSLLSIAKSVLLTYKNMIIVQIELEISIDIGNTNLTEHKYQTKNIEVISYIGSAALFY